MTYTINVRIYQTNTNAFFKVVERSSNLGNGLGSSNWTEANDQHVLTMGVSGTSGMLRLLSNTGEHVTIVLGVHNYVRWVDVVADGDSHLYGGSILQQYYSGVPRDRRAVRERQAATHTCTNAKGRRFTVSYSQPEGENLVANVIIG